MFSDVKLTADQRGPLQWIVTRCQKQLNRWEYCMNCARERHPALDTRESEAGQSASFCHACYFLCDWVCERRGKRESMIRQRSHVIARQSEHKLCSPLPVTLCHPLLPFESNVQYFLGKRRKIIGLFDLCLLSGLCVTVVAHTPCLLQLTLTWRNSTAKEVRHVGRLT